MKKQDIKKYVIIGLTCLFLLIAGISYSLNYNKVDSYISLDESQTDSEEQEISPAPIENFEETKEDIIPQIYVHICGQVKKPGVYSVDYGSRLIDVIELAGGFCKEAAKDYMNQAQVVEDGSRVYIPSNEEVEELSVEEYMTSSDLSNEQSGKDNLVNINKADENELMTLPGIGESKAKSILEYRNSHGDFKKIEDIMKISGIKEGLFRKIEDKISVR